MRHAIEVEVTKTLRTSVFLVFDDEDPRQAHFFKDGKLKEGGVAMDSLATNEAKNIGDSDWIDDDEYATEGSTAVSTSDVSEYDNLEVSTLADGDIPDVNGMTAVERDLHAEAVAGLAVHNARERAEREGVQS